MAKKEAKLCANCLYEGVMLQQNKGHFLIELILWLFILVPGLIYSCWRVASRRDICPQCGSENLLPLNSPKAQQLLANPKTDKT